MEVNACTTGKPLLGQNYLQVVQGRVSGSKGVKLEREADSNDRQTKQAKIFIFLFIFTASGRLFSVSALLRRGRGVGESDGWVHQSTEASLISKDETKHRAYEDCMPRNNAREHTPSVEFPSRCSRQTRRMQKPERRVDGKI